MAEEKERPITTRVAGHEGQSQATREADAGREKMKEGGDASTWRGSFSTGPQGPAVKPVPSAKLSLLDRIKALFGMK